MITQLQAQLCDMLDSVSSVRNSQTAYSRRRRREGFAGDVSCFERTDSHKECLEKLKAAESSVCSGRTEARRKRRTTGECLEVYVFHEYVRAYCGPRCRGK